MSLTVAVQMDPIEKIRIAGNSTFALLLEAQARGHRLLYYTPDRLSMRDGKVVAQVQPLTVRDVEGDHYGVEAAERLDLARVDVVLMRQDPPFDMAYITATHLLERIHPKTLVVNDPAEVRNAPEKLFVTHFPQLMPPTLITRDKGEIESFREEFGEIVMKPLHGHGGAAVLRVLRQDPNFGSLYDLFAATFKEPWVVQRFLPQVSEGDKRIILVDGKAAGADQPGAGRKRHPLEHGPRRRREADRPHRPRARDLRRHRAGAAPPRPHLRRHRRDRRQTHRDQRHLADRHPRHQDARRAGPRGGDLGRDRGPGWFMSRDRRGREPLFTRPPPASPASAHRRSRAPAPPPGGR